MGRHKTREEWIFWFNEYEKLDEKFNWDKYYQFMAERKTQVGIETFKSNNIRRDFLYRYKLYLRDKDNFRKKKIKAPKHKIVDNYFMKNKNRKTEIEKFINELTIDELRDIARVHIEDQDKKPKNEKSEQRGKYKSLNKTKIAILLNEHRTTQYKTKKERNYRWDFIKQYVDEIFTNSNFIYGSERICIILERDYDILISARTLRNYMSRWGFVCKTRRKRRKREVKETKTKYIDLVQRNFNPIEDIIVATDITFIPAKSIYGFIYLSVAISHKTKMIESFQISEYNDLELVFNTLKNIPQRKGLIVHSDHGFQYSHYSMVELAETMRYQISMSRVGNSLDNREVEYFFSNLKSECLNSIPTYKMNIEEIIPHILSYINWYNCSRVQSKLNWMSPNEFIDSMNFPNN